MNLPKAKAGALAAALLTLSGCAVGPDYVPPKLEIPNHWAEGETTANTLPHLDDWWQTFQDPLLNQLINEAVRANLNVKIAETRIREARANYMASISAGLPNVDGRSNIMRRRNNANISTNGNGTGGGNFGVGNQIINIFQAGFDASWELDIFGGIRRGIEASDTLLESEEEGRRATLVSLLGEVARLYIEIRANQQMLEVTRHNLQSQEQTLQLTETRRKAGLASELEQVQSEGLTAETRAQLPAYETSQKEAIHALSVLLAQPPGKLLPRFEQTGPIPETSEQGVGDLPAELVKRRPDIRKAERLLASSNAEIGVATAELYPRISLNTFLGLQNTNIAGLTPMGKSWSLAASLSTPIFNWGRIQSNIRAKQALNEQAFFNYQTTVLQAYREVEDALIAHTQLKLRIKSLQNAVQAQELAMNLSTERWRNGLASYLDVLLAERSLFQAQQQLVETKAQHSTQLVALFKSLGGGWEIAGAEPKVEVDWMSKPSEFLLDELHETRKYRDRP